MMNFSTLKGLNIPEGKVVKIQVGGETLWEHINEPTEPAKTFNYVSLGDSIAVGHRIDENWEDDYGWDAQYRKTDPKTGEIHTETVIVPNSYTDKISKYLQGVYGESNVFTKSFAVSGSMVFRKPGDNRSLLEVIYDAPVQEALSKADLVTISIGANSILEPGLDRLPSFLAEGGSLDDLEITVEDALRKLADPTYEYSYKVLFDQLTSINPDAKYVFTTVHNPMKYLYVARGTWDNDFQDSFLGTWLNSIPYTNIGGWIVSREIKKLILDTELITGIRGRINGDGSGWEGIGAWTERYVETGGVSVHDGKSYLGLNQIIRKSIADYNNPNITFTEIHGLFDTVPDRQGAGKLHYNDLVNMQITRGYDANNLDWSELWGEAEGTNPDEKIRNYWTGIITKYSNGLNFDFEGLAAELSPIIEDQILSKDFDPHPRADGHYVMYRAFADTLGWQSLNTVTYNANGGTSTMESQKVLDYSIVNGVSKKIYSVLKANAFSPQTGHHFTGWKDRNGNSYSDEQAIPITSDITLDAQWAKNKWTLTVIQADKTVQALNALDSVDYSNRQLQINKLIKSLNSNKAAWDNQIGRMDTEEIEVEYGTPIMLSVQGRVEVSYDFNNRAKKPNCTIKQHNGSAYVVDNPDTQIGKLVTADFYMPDEDVTIEYWFNYASSTSIFASYSHRWWEAYIRNKNLEVKYTSSNG